MYKCFDLLTLRANGMIITNIRLNKDRWRLVSIMVSNSGESVMCHKWSEVRGPKGPSIAQSLVIVRGERSGIWDPSNDKGLFNAHQASFFLPSFASFLRFLPSLPSFLPRGGSSLSILSRFSHQKTMAFFDNIIAYYVPVATR